MSVSALLYMASTPLLSKRYSEKGRYYTWLVIVIALVLPFRPQWNNPLISVGTLGDASPFFAEINTGTANPRTIPINLPSLDNIVASGAIPNIPWWQLISMIWLAGVVVFLAYHGKNYHRFTKMVRRWSEPITDDGTISLFQNLKSEMAIRKLIPLYLCPCVGSPMLLGLFKPRILLPTVDLMPDELRFILKHELVHYKRKDLLYKYLIMIARALHWFNPIVHLMARAIAVLCEKSCDTEVVQHQEADVRQSYGETIIGVAKYQSKLKTVLSTGFYSDKRDIKNRISSIMDVRKKKAGVILVCVAIVLTMSGGYLSAAGADGWSEILERFGAENQIDNLPIPSYVPEGFAVEYVWVYPAFAESSDDTSSESTRRALYVRVGNGTQSFDMEIKHLMDGEDVFDSWMLYSPETTINGRRAVSDAGWLSIQIDYNISYTFMWGAFEPALTNPHGDDTLVRIAESIQ